jgi:hypothetical protein
MCDRYPAGDSKRRSSYGILDFRVRGLGGDAALTTLIVAIRSLHELDYFG